MAKIDLPKRSGKRSKVREKSVKSQGILKTILSGNPVGVSVGYGKIYYIILTHIDVPARLAHFMHYASTC